MKNISVGSVFSVVGAAKAGDPLLAVNGEGSKTPHAKQSGKVVRKTRASFVMSVGGHPTNLQAGRARE